MQFMEIDRNTLDRLLPGLRERLAEVSLTELESEKNPGIEIFRTLGGTNLLVPKEHGGLGADALDSVRVMRALAAVAPSTAVATMMHQFSVSTMVAAVSFGAESGVNPALLDSITQNHLLLSSAFAEGRTDQDILQPTMTATPVEGGFLVSGTKKPCSLSRSMNLMTASVALPPEHSVTGLGIAVIPADAEGLSVHPFWSSFVLAGAESDEVRLTDVFVPAEQMVAPPIEQAIALQMTGLVHFQLSVSAAYTGIASELVRRVLERGRGSVTDRADLAVRIEAAALATESVARQLIAGDPIHITLAAAQVARFAAQQTIGEVVNRAVELLGGMAYVSSSDVAYLAAASHGISFHPPSRSSAASSIVDYFTAG